jgi:hypothetical protein
MSRKKFPVTPPGIDPGTFQLVARCLNHYATPGHDWAQWDDNIKMGFKEVIYVFSRLRAESDGGFHVY